MHGTHIPGVDTGAYYVWFGTAIRYLVDDDGFGLGEVGLRRIYDDMRSGIPFPVSFRNRTGSSVADFEADFWSLMNDFLPAR